MFEFQKSSSRPPIMLTQPKEQLQAVVIIYLQNPIPFMHRVSIRCGVVKIRARGFAFKFPYYRAFPSTSIQNRKNIVSRNCVNGFSNGLE